MAKQTFTTGQVLTAAQVNSLQTNDFNQTVSVKTAAYVLAAADKGTRIEFNTSGSVTCTVNTGLFDAGDTVIIQNRGAGDVTVTAGTATVNTAGSLVLSQYQSGTLYFISASASIFFAAAVGDLTAVTSGTGISISNAGGPVPTITNSMATEISAKGDLIVGTGSGTFDNLTVGANGTTLVADSATATGLKWAAPSTPTFVGCSLYKSAAQTIAFNTETVITFNTELFDTDGFHSTSTNTDRITIPTGKGGYYFVFGQIVWTAANTGYRLAAVYKNGTLGTLLGSTTIDNGNNNSFATAQVSTIVNLIAGDYVNMTGLTNTSGGGDARSAEYYTKFFVQYLGA